MRLWVDDERTPPEGYLWAKSVNSAKEFIINAEKNNEPIELLDLDHDLGRYACEGGDCIKLVEWMAETGRHYPIKIHTMNPVGRENMQQLINRYWC